MAAQRRGLASPIELGSKVTALGLALVTAQALSWAAPAGPPAAARSVAASDQGIFSTFDAGLEVHWPAWLGSPPSLVVLDEQTGQRWAMYGDDAIAPALPHEGPALRVRTLAGRDRDGDGIPDPLDILLGARKAALNGAAYRGGYERLAYPGGDVAPDHGVCTDVLVRALRNAGWDLQRLVHEDARARPRAYPMVRRPDANIDHRRVKTLLPWFRRHWRSLSPALTPPAEAWLPGDVVFFDTLRGPEPDHVGVVSDRVGPSGLPLVVNNWTDGFRTSEMDLLGSVPVTHRFRVPGGRLAAAPEERGLTGLLRRRGLELPPATRQLVLVSAPGWGARRGELRRLRRDGGRWRSEGAPVAVDLGAAGLGWGRGLWPLAPQEGPQKREGDRRSPAGLFRVGTAFGAGPAPRRATWPWRPAGPDDRWIDDPASPHYNRWAARAALARGAPAGEPLADYRLAVVVEHNPPPALPGAGSAIFLHEASRPPGPTLGCTALPDAALRALVEWLRPADGPLLLQVPDLYLP